MEEISNEALMHLLRHCFNLMRRRYHQTVHGKVGTQHGQGKILSVLRREDGIGQKELAEELQIRPASLSELLDKMQKSGWVQRRVNEKDRRKINVYLTVAGRDISQQMIEARRETADGIFGVLTAAEQVQLEKLLSKLAVELENPCSEEVPNKADQ
ncbi:MAG: MarR family transcriptional regulator [Oscillospiraceae bacterium]|nr:MarR family transcriptional regulator [Oscillospiraceae bacterium]